MCLECDDELGFSMSAGEQGPTGATGPAGTNGTNGTDGTDGTNGIDGADGTNGTDGVDGADGSSASKTYLFHKLLASGTEASTATTGAWVTLTTGAVAVGDLLIQGDYLEIDVKLTAKGPLDNGLPISHFRMSIGGVPLINKYPSTSNELLSLYGDPDNPREYNLTVKLYKTTGIMQTRCEWSASAPVGNFGTVTPSNAVTAGSILIDNTLLNGVDLLAANDIRFEVYQSVASSVGIGAVTIHNIKF